MEKIINEIFYTFYLVHRKLSRIIDRINPFSYIKNIPKLPQKYVKRFEQDDKDLEELNNDLYLGLDIKWARGSMIGFFSIFTATLFIAFVKLMNIEITSSNWAIFLIVVIGWFLSYFFVFRKDKYITLFKSYECWTKKQKWNKLFRTIIVYLGVITLFLLSLYL